MKAETVILNGKIYTMEATCPQVEALAISRGRIIALGDTVSMRGYIGPASEVLDLAGRTALPGFIDAHLHFVAYGLSLQRVDLTGSSSPGETVQRVQDRAESVPEGEWILGRGWDRNLWSPPDFPRREFLDAAVAGHPVALGSKDGHALWLNSRAVRELGIATVSVGTWGGQVLRDPATGEPTGILVEEAAGAALEQIGKPGRQVLRQAIMAAAANALRLGVTSVHDCEEDEELAAFTSLWREQAMPLRVYMLIPRDNLDAAIQLGLQTGMGDEWLRIGHLKLFADGALGSHTADMLAPYEGEPTNRGVAVLEEALSFAERPQARQGTLRDIVERAVQARIAPAIHAIGDRANRRVLDVYSETRPLWSGAHLRPRIEHVQLLAGADMPRLAQLGVIASMQPIHATSDMDMAEAYWGARSAGAYAWRSLLRVGTVLAFGSDCPVETIDPLAGIHAAVTRQRPDGTPAGGWRPEESLTVYEAVRAYTWGGAYAAGEEDIKGTLAEGKAGDLVVLSDDIFQASPQALRDVRVLGTVCAGRLAYSGGL